MTPERYARIRAVLTKRQTSLTVCTEQVHKPHNLAAIMRTCDAVGIHHIHSVVGDDNRIRKGTSKGSHLWLRRTAHDNIQDAVTCLKQQNMQVLVTHLSDDAVDFREIDYTQPTAIILGQEKYGATDAAVTLSDKRITIPMMGMVQSLNVSVAAALVLYEAQRQRQNAGMYEQQQLDEEICQQLIFERGHTPLYEHCKKKGLPYPAIGEHGEVIASDEWWQQAQLTPEALAQIDMPEIDENDLSTIELD